MSFRIHEVIHLPARRRSLDGLLTFTPADDTAHVKPSDLLRTGSLVYVVELERDGDYHFRLALLLKTGMNKQRRRYALVRYTDTGDEESVAFHRVHLFMAEKR